MLNKLIDGIISSASAAIKSPAYHPSSQKLGGVWDSNYSTSAGIRVDQESILGLPAIVRGVSIVSSTVASVPFYVFKTVGDEGDKVWDRKHPSWDVVTRSANKEFTQDVFFQTMTAWAMTWGNAVAVIDRPLWPRGPMEIIPLLPDRTAPIRITKDMIERYDVDETLLGTLYYTTIIDNEPRSFVASDCIHIRGLGSPHWGYDIVDLLSESLGGAAAAQRYGNTFYGQGATASGFVQMPSGMSAEAEKRFAESLGRETSGISNAHRLVVLEEGSTFQPWSVDPSKAQFLEGKQFDVRTLAQTIGIKPHKLIDGADNSYNSLSEANREHMSDDIMPWVRRWTNEFNDKLLTSDQKKKVSHIIDIDDEYLEWVPFGERAEGCVSLYNNGIIQKEEARRRCNFGPSHSPFGTRYRMPMNIIFEDESSLLHAQPPTGNAQPSDAPTPPDDSPDEQDDSQNQLAHEKQQRELMEAAWVDRESRRLCGRAVEKAKLGGKVFDEWTISLADNVPKIPGIESESLHAMYEAFRVKMNQVVESATEDELLPSVTNAVAELETLNREDTSDDATAT